MGDSQVPSGLLDHKDFDCSYREKHKYICTVYVNLTVGSVTSWQHWPNRLGYSPSPLSVTVVVMVIEVMTGEIRCGSPNHLELEMWQSFTKLH